jgi:hypothetical protein
MPVPRKQIISSMDTLFDFEIFQPEQRPSPLAQCETARNEQGNAEGQPRGSVALDSPVDEVGDVSGERFSMFAGTGDSHGVSLAGLGNNLNDVRPYGDLNVVSWLDESSDDEFSSRSQSPCPSSSSSRRDAGGVSIVSGLQIPRGSLSARKAYQSCHIGTCVDRILGTADIGERVRKQAVIRFR